MPSIYIATKNKSRSESLANDGDTLILHFDLVSSIGEDNGLSRLDDYIYTPTEQILEFLKKNGATDEEIEKANPVIWFTAEEGLHLINKYIDVIEDYHSISESTRQDVVPELKNFGDIFKVLVNENNEWHFEYDI